MDRSKRIATRDDWKIQPMPDARLPVTIQKEFSPLEFERIRTGTIPEEMEHRWFIYFEDPWLHIHRSWTGICVYQVRFHVHSCMASIDQAFVNADREQNPRYSGERAARTLEKLLEFHGWC